MGFSYHRPVGFAAPDGFDVFSDNGAGQIDPDDPMAAVDAEEGQADYELFLPAPELPIRLAVRARCGQDTGPISKIIFVPLSAPPAPPESL